MKILTSERVRLVPLSEVHESEFVRLANIPEINRRVNKPPFYSQAHFSELLSHPQHAKTRLIWMIEQNARVVGAINTAASGRDGRMFQGGYWIDPAFWGQGIASAALLLVKTHLLEDRGAERVQALVEPDNGASIRVLEKCGYEREGLLRKFYPSVDRGLIDVFMYASIA
jgi:ribosomal-protein-alanine N-acetyltransferase